MSATAVASRPRGLALMLGWRRIGFVLGLFEQWPQRLPRWLERWALQVMGVIVNWTAGLKR